MVTNGAGCSAISLPISVAFYPATISTISPSGNVLLPQGSSITLTANSGSAYNWSNGNTTQSITVNTPGTYTVTVTDANGCQSEPATSQVSYISPSNMISAGGSTSFCEGDSVVLTSAFPSGNQWFLNGSAITGATQNIYSAKLSGYYKVRNTPVSGTPVFSDSVQVTVNIVPNTVITLSDTVCKGNPAMLSVQPQTGITYNWYMAATGGASLGTGLSFITPPLHQNESFFVELENGFGCVRPNRFEVIAMIHPQPVAGFSVSVPEQTSSGFEVHFTNSATNATTWFWDFGDAASQDNTSSDPDPVHNYLQPGNYNAMLIVTTAEGCTDTLIKTVAVLLDNNIFIPSGFTPNNDGNNDWFRVRGNNISYSNMSIYNQWGQRLWHSPKELNGWDGTCDGQYVNNGTYAYTIEVTYENGTTEFFKGNINVIR
jgi:large repetitive protein